MSALTVQRKQRGGLGMLGGVLDVIDAYRLARTGPRDEGAVGLLSDDRNPAIVVVGLPDHEPASNHR